MPAPRDDIDIDDLVKRYRSGASVRQLSRDLGAATGTLRRLLTRAGVELRDKSTAGKNRARKTELIPEILARFDAGERVGIIANALGISDDGVRSILTDHGRDPRANLPSTRIDEIIRRYEAGESCAEIAEALHSSHSTIARHLRRAGVKMRTPAEGVRVLFERNPGRIEQTRAAQRLAIEARRVEFDVERARHAYEAGRSAADIGAELGVSAFKIYEGLRAAGVHIRSHREARFVVDARESSENIDAKARRYAKIRLKALGRPMTERALRNRAASKQATKPHIGAFEDVLAEMLRGRGLQVRQQVAVDWYNLDLAVDHLAIEIHHSAHRPMSTSRADLRRRAEHLINAGWWVLYVWVRPFSKPTLTGRTWDLFPKGLGEGAADEVVAHLDQLRRDPSSVGKYRVITGHGEEATRRRSEGQQSA